MFSGFLQLPPAHTANRQETHKFRFVELIQGFYHQWNKMACMGGMEKIVGRIKFANWGCKKKGNINKVQGGDKLPAGMSPAGETEVYNIRLTIQKGLRTGSDHHCRE